jgi:hypothetical protein
MTCALMFSLVLAAGCAAVPAPDLAAPGPQSAHAALAKLRAGRAVRLHRPDAERLDGPLRRLTSDSATVETYRGRVTVDLAEVDTVWVRHVPRGRTVGQGALGGLIGGAVVAAIMVLSTTGDCSCDDPGIVWVFVPYVMGFTTGGGAIMGALGAAGAPDWLLRYPTPRRRPW